jgi:hypothetical protein
MGTDLGTFALLIVSPELQVFPDQKHDCSARRLSGDRRFVQVRVGLGANVKWAWAGHVGGVIVCTAVDIETVPRARVAHVPSLATARSTTVRRE